MIRERYPGIEFKIVWRDGIFDSIGHKQRNILVLDDQKGVARSSWSVVNIFTRVSHHKNLL